MRVKWLRPGASSSDSAETKVLSGKEDVGHYRKDPHPFRLKDGRYRSEQAKQNFDGTTASESRKRRLDVDSSTNSKKTALWAVFWVPF